MYRSRWRSALIDATTAVLAVAIALHIAVRLVESVLPQLLFGLTVMVAIVVVTTAAISVTRFRRSRW